MANSQQTPLRENVKSGISKRSQFNLDYESILTCDFGDLVPVVMKEMVPGDTFDCNVSSFVRLSPLATPTYGRIKGNVNYFFVPTRILMPDGEFESSITGGSDGSVPERFPFISPSVLGTLRVKYGSAGDTGSLSGVELNRRSFDKLLSYLGLPQVPTNAFSVSLMYDDAEHAISLLPFLAYNRIFGDYYFPYGLENDASVEEFFHSKYSGLITTSNYTSYSTALMILLQCHKVCYTKDFFTTAFVRPQRGGEVFAGLVAEDSTQGNNVVTSPSTDGQLDRSKGMLSALTLKWATSIQRFLERNNIAGGRYFEQMLARFGVNIAASRLDRSEYLGGNDFYVSVSDVTSTSATDQASLGEMAGKGIGLGRQGASYTAQEHGFFVALLHYVPETGYPQALDKMWTRRTKFDYFTPELEDTGMQPVYNKEIYSLATYQDVSGVGESSTSDRANGVFGYVPRYAEYKFSNPILGGDFVLKPEVSEDSESNTDYNNMLDSMHLFRIFDGVPSLGQPFVTIDEQNGGFDRIFQDTNTDFDHFFVNNQISLRASRPMLGFAEAGLSFTHEENGRQVSVPYGGMRL